MSSSTDKELDRLIQERIQHLVTALSSEPHWENAAARIHSALPHLNPSTPTSLPLTPPPSTSPLSSYIDHTLLKADALPHEIQSLCTEAHAHSFYSVCVNPHHVPTALSYLSSLSAPNPSPVRVVAVCGFPLGQTSTSCKAFEAASLRTARAHEVDVVINLSLLLTSSYPLLYEDLRQTVDAASPLPVKVIIEAAVLTPSAIIDACVISVLAGAKFVKTSTGFHAKGGATVEAVRLMRRVVGWENGVGVKASGGVRDAQTARAMIEAGATRLGTSASVAIAQGDTHSPPQQAAAAAGTGASGGY